MSQQISREDAEQSEDIFTDFETEEGSCGGVSPDGDPYWGAYCPQPDCGHLNLFRGAPEGFVSRPYACEECNWVSLMHSSVRDLEVLD